MLNYAETVSISTIVSVTPLPPSQHQEYTPDSLLSMLSALLAHPEFREGLVDGYEDFESSYEPAPLTEEEMVDEVEMDLSRAVTERCRKLSQLEGLEPPSYFYNLGHVVGTIAKGLSYAETQQLTL